MSYAASLRRRATYQDVLDAPEHMVAELIDGVLHTMPRPRSRHALATSRMGVRLGRDYDDDGGGGPGGWWILDEPEVHFGDDVLVPDLAGWRRASMPEFPDVAYFTLAPDWVCEVISPATGRRDRFEKRAIYLREGVSWLWLLDPDARGLETFERREGDWTLIAALKDDDPVSVPPFDAISFSLASLWA